MSKSKELAGLMDLVHVSSRPSHSLPFIGRRSFSQLGVVALALAAALSSIPSAQAASATWVGNNNVLWSDTTGNWTGGLGTGGQPASGDSLIFGAAGTAGATLTDDLMTPGTFNVAGITFNAGAAAYTINPNTAGTNGFTLSGGITNSSAVTQAINDLITLTNAAHTVTLTSATDVVNLGGNISAGGTASNITTSGLGTLILSGNNSFGTGAGGGVTVGSGTTLQLQANGANTSAGVSTALNTASGKLSFGATSTLQLKSDSAVTFAGGDNMSILAGTSTLNINVNQLTGAGSNNVISFATAGLTHGGSNGTTTTYNITGGNGYSLSLGTVTTTTSSANTTDFFNPTTANVTIAGITSGAGGGHTFILDGTSTGNVVSGTIGNATASNKVTKQNTSTWRLDGTNTYTGVTAVNGGTLIGTNTQAFGSGANVAGQINVGAGTLKLLNDNGPGTQTGQTIIYGGTTVSNAGYNVTASNAASVINVGNNGNAGSTANTIQLGALVSATTTTFTNANGYNLTFAGNTTSGGSATFTNNMANGTLTLGTLTESAATAQTFTFNGTSATAVTSVGAISSSNGTPAAINITQSGSGTLFLTGASTNTGTTTLNSGTVKLGNVSALGTTTIGASLSGTLDFNGNAITNTVADKALAGTTFTNTGSSVVLTGMGNIGASAARSFNLDGTGNMTFGQQFTGQYTITKNGSNTVTLSGTGANTLIAVVNSGTLVLGKTAAVTAVSGNVTINGGTVQLSGSGGNQIGGNVTVASGGVFDLNGQSETVGALSLAGTGISSGGALVNNNGSTTSTLNGAVTLTGNASMGGSANVTLASAIGDGGNAYGVTKVGAGTVTLNGTNTYTGGTTINTGVLSVGNNSALGTGAVIVNTGGTLLIQAGFNAANTVTMAGGSYNKSINSGTAYSYSATSNFVGGQPDTTASLIAGTSGAAQTLSTSFTATSLASNDGIRVSDVFNLSGTGTDLFTLQLQVSALPSNSILGWNSGGVWVDATTGNTGNNAILAQQGYLGSFATFQGTYGTTLSNYVGAYGIDTTGNTVWAVLNHNSEFAAIAVPEPSTYTMLGLGLLSLWALRRKGGKRI